MFSDDVCICFSLQKDEKRNSPSPPPCTAAATDRVAPSPALNLSYKSEDDKHDDVSDKSESELADIDDDTIDDSISENSMVCSDTEEKVKTNEENGSNTKKAVEENGIAAMGQQQTNPNMLQFWSNIQGHIQELVKSAIVNVKEEEKEVVDNNKEGELRPQPTVTAQ